jgi:hypothetical protein
VTFNGKRKLFVIAMAFTLVITNTFTQTANAVKAKVAPMCVSPIMKYSKMHKLTQEQLYDLLRLTGFKGKALKTAWAVAMKESHGNPLSHNGNARTGDNSYGLFQVNLYGPLKARISQYKLSSASDLYDPVTNAQVAFKMSAEGKNWTAWKAGTNQQYNGVVQYWLKAVPSV